MNRTVLRRTLTGALVGGSAFGVVALVQALRSEAELARLVQPVLVLVVLGLTVGGLAGPLVGAALARWRSR